MIFVSNPFRVLILFVCSLSLCFSAHGALSHLRSSSRRKLQLELKQPKADAGSHTPAGVSAGSGDDDGDDDDDDDDDDDGDDQNLGNASTHESYDAVEMRITQNIKNAESDLAANLRQQLALKTKMSFLLDQEKSDKQIEDAAVLVANQTESEAMATMLSKMWKEMRMFEVPSYAAHVEGEVRRLKLKEKALENKLHVEQAKLVEHRKKRIDEAKQKSEAEQMARQAELVKATTQAGDRAASDQSGNPNKRSDARMNINFWTMHRDQQARLIEQSVVFLLFGVLCAFLYKYASRVYPNVFNPALQPHEIANDKTFTFGLFSCFEDRNICLLGCLCPYLRWSDTVDRKKLLSYPRAVAFLIFMMILYPFTAGLSFFGICAVGVFFRQKLRARYGIQRGTPATVFWDVAAWLCCQPCAICQEAREEVVVRST